MCLLIFAHGVDPRFPLVVAANRDEFHARPTEPSHFWPEQPDLLAGRDLEQGGTWMGITRDGRFAAITNYRDPAHTAPAPRSRGELPLRYLTGPREPEQFLRELDADAGEYAGFNLLVGDAGALWYFSNSPERGRHSGCRLDRGIYGLSNARLDTPWPKVELGKRRLAALLQAGEPAHDSLSGVVADRRLADPGTLEQQGLDGEMDRLLSAQFITTSRYGTRSSTTLWIEHGGARWRELSFDAEGAVTAVREEAFELHDAGPGPRSRG
jgi:uncharacterized protein with NRDE domain